MVASARREKRKGKISMKESFGEKENVVFYEGESFGKKENVVFYASLRTKRREGVFFAFGSKKEISSTPKHFSYISERLRIYYKV
jgi:hypothetical protein